MCIFLQKPNKDPSDPKWYRPFIFLKIMGKIAEKIMLNRILPEALKVIPNFQHGFAKGRGKYSRTNYGKSTLHMRCT